MTSASGGEGRWGGYMAGKALASKPEAILALFAFEASLAADLRL
jgi:hypothetical protein